MNGDHMKQRLQAMARYFPERADGTNQEHRYVTGDTRDELIINGEACNPNPEKLRFACIWATSEGPLVWESGVGWYSEADEYVPE